MQNPNLKIDDELDGSHKLWRYMDLSKFISLIEKEALWLARADTFQDKHEGRIPDDMRKIFERFYNESTDEGDVSVINNADDFQDYLRKNTFISCWHKNFDENMVMWEIYGRGTTNAVAIQTTVKKLKSSLDKSMPLDVEYWHSLMLKNVIYRRADDIPGMLLYEDCFFIKRPHFSFEEEVRLSLDTYSRFYPTKDTPYGYYFPININEFIEKILIHPDSPDWFMDVINSIKKRYKIFAPVERGAYGNK